MFNYHDVQMAMALIRLPADGTQANRQAREKAAHLLLNAASAFRSLAGTNETNAADYLRHMAAELEITADMA
jgi:hypothetical protein